MNKIKTLETMLILAGALIVFNFIFELKILLYIAVGLILIGAFINPVAVFISKIWLKLSEWIGFIMSKVILTVIFFFFLLPIALLSRLFSKRDIILKRKNDTYYYLRNHKYDAADLRNPW